MFLVEDDVILIKLNVKYTTILVLKQEKLMGSLDRAAGETRSQSQKSANRAFLVNSGETPKERTPRSSMSSWKDERSKPKQKEWGAEQPSSAVFVPVPYLKRTTPEPQRNETSV